MLSDSFVPFQRSVTRRFRELLLDRYPALACGPNAAIYREIAQYVLFARFIPSEHEIDVDENESRIVLPAATVAAMAKRRVDGHGFSAQRLLNGFCEEVWPLSAREHRYINGQARTVSQDVPEDIRTAFLGDQVDWEWDMGHRVWFVSGEPLTRNTRHRARLAYAGDLLAAAARTPVDHPASGLLDYLNKQPQGALSRILNRNWPDVIALYQAMPIETTRDRRRREHVARVMAAIMDFEKLIYIGGERTARVYATGLTINQLPREMRQTALRGAVHCDIRACQLAVASKLWGLPMMTKFLASHPAPSIWRELIAHLKVSENQKDVLKKALYAAVFGARLRTIRCILVSGTRDVVGLGRMSLALKFLEHPLIAELIAHRDRQIEGIAASGEIIDAFGKRVGLANREPRSLLAQQIQSWEMRLMLSLLPALQADSRLQMLTHLHDGCAVYSSRPSDIGEAIGKRLSKAFNETASEIGIDTSLEVSE